VKNKDNDESWISVCFFYLCMGIYCVVATVFTFVMAVFTLPSQAPILFNKVVSFFRDRF
jgi:hypothetical protein